MSDASSDTSISDNIDGASAPAGTATGTIPPADEAAIRQVLALYCQLCDDGDFDHWVELFTDDARFTVMGRTHSGRPALKEFMAAAQPPEKRGKHFLGQSLITGVGNRASGVTDYIFVAKASEPESERRSGYAITSAGRYLDTFLRCPDGAWRIHTREIVFL